MAEEKKPTTRKKAAPKKEAPAKTSETTGRDKTLNIHERIRLIMIDVDYLKKDDTIAYKSVKYNAVTEQKVTTAVRQSLINHGVTCVPDGEIKWNQAGTLNTVIMHYRLTNIDNPDDFIIIPTIGQGADTQDKGTNKAVTGAFKYLLLRTFNIPTGDDPDQTSSDELGDNHFQENKKKYIKLLSDHKHLFTDKELKAASFNEKWDVPKIWAMIDRLQKFIDQKEDVSQTPPDSGKAVKEPASEAGNFADQSGQNVSDSLDI